MRRKSSRRRNRRTTIRSPLRKTLFITNARSALHRCLIQRPTSSTLRTNIPRRPFPLSWSTFKRLTDSSSATRVPMISPIFLDLIT
ncbi:unnamed protein product, partial [Mesorhabditis belari]|uniref:Uncharacterized protein n=1 Tax=Mesorhabditis belari TaxID=2138241 RepID=A0AAF3F3I1_9BILA